MGLSPRTRNDPCGGDTTELERACRELVMFIEACLLHVDGDPRATPAVWDGLRLFVVGAARGVARHRSLGPAQFIQIAWRGMCYLGMTEAQAWHFARLGERLARRADAGHAVREGEAVLDQWIVGKDNNAILRLAQLHAQWQNPG